MIVIQRKVREKEDRALVGDESPREKRGDEFVDDINSWSHLI